MSSGDKNKGSRSRGQPVIQKVRNCKCCRDMRESREKWFRRANKLYVSRYE